MVCLFIMCDRFSGRKQYSRFSQIFLIQGFVANEDELVASTPMEDYFMSLNL